MVYRDDEEAAKGVERVDGARLDEVSEGLLTLDALKERIAALQDELTRRARERVGSEAERGGETRAHASARGEGPSREAGPLGRSGRFWASLAAAGWLSTVIVTAFWHVSATRKPPPSVVVCPPASPPAPSKPEVALPPIRDVTHAPWLHGLGAP